jgi:hypothetical protein
MQLLLVTLTEAANQQQRSTTPSLPGAGVDLEIVRRSLAYASGSEMSGGEVDHLAVSGPDAK